MPSRYTSFGCRAAYPSAVCGQEEEHMNFRVGSEGVRNRVAANYCQVTPAHSLFSEKNISADPVGARPRLSGSPSRLHPDQWVRR
jgi:hypothetical protein